MLIVCIIGLCFGNLRNIRQICGIYSCPLRLCLVEVVSPEPLTCTYQQIYLVFTPFFGCYIFGRAVNSCLLVVCENCFTLNKVFLDCTRTYEFYTSSTDELITLEYHVIWRCFSAVHISLVEISPKISSEFGGRESCD